MKDLNLLNALKQYLLVILISITIVGCTQQVADVTQIPTVSFQNEVLPIFQTNCTFSGCHGIEGEAEEDLRFTDYNEIMKSIKANSLVDSKAYQAITNPWTIMPPSPYKPLSKDQRTLIAVWILQGAKNNK